MLFLQWLTATLIFIIGIIAAGHALLHKRDPRASLAWVILCISVPVLGPLIYLMFGFNRIQRKALRIIRYKTGRRNRLEKRMHKEGNLHDPSPSFSYDSSIDALHTDAITEKEAMPPPPALPPVFTDLGRVGDAVNGNRLHAGNRVEALHNGDEAYPAMLAEIRGAKESVWLSSYIFDNDPVGRLFIKELSAAFARGVDVRVLLDGIGIFICFPSVHKLLQRAGVPVALFLPPRLFPPQFMINLRNHRKLLIVDGKKAFTGGLNISIGNVRALYKKEENVESTDFFYLGGEKLKKTWQFTRPIFRAFRPLEVQDLHFSIEGPIIHDLEKAFADDWNFSTDEEISIMPLSDKNTGSALCRCILDGPDNNFERYYSTILGQISAAKHSVRIITPYFLPMRELVSALQCAALRGVDVSIILPEKSDQRIVQWATFNILGELLERKINIYYQPAPFAHTKLLLIDDYHVHMGSANLDPRSLRLNFELTIEIFGLQLAKNMNQYFMCILNMSRQYTMQKWEERKLFVRLRDAVCCMASPYL